jgi:hypothetical protein
LFYADDVVSLGEIVTAKEKRRKPEAVLVSAKEVCLETNSEKNTEKIFHENMSAFKYLAYQNLSSGIN